MSAPTPFNTVVALFAAMSAVDHQKMRDVVTADFQILEIGQDWRIDDLINVVDDKQSTRRNFFCQLKNHIDGNVAWVSYWNKATFTESSKPAEVFWLESAVLVKVEQQWLLQMLHSTRVEPHKVPKSIEFIEQVK